MIQQLRKVGNDNALVLDKAIMDLIGLEEDGQVLVTVSDGSLVITPVNPKRVSQERFEAALNRVVSERREVLKRLAE